MLQKLGVADVFSAVQRVVEDNTGLRCYDEIPKDAPAPFYFIELVGWKPADTKTMFRDRVNVWIHAIAEGGSSVQIFELMDELREAMTEEVTTQAILEDQKFNGLQTVKDDETGEKHAVLEFEFVFCYGFKVKVDISA